MEKIGVNNVINNLLLIKFFKINRIIDIFYTGYYFIENKHNRHYNKKHWQK